MKNVPYLFQGNYSGNNSHISNIFYGVKADDDDFPNDEAKSIRQKTIGYKGCGIVSMIMAVCAIGDLGLRYGELIEKAAQFSMDNGYKTDSGTNIKRLIPAYISATMHGMSSCNLNNASEAYTAVQNGDIAVIGVNGTGGLFTNGRGHIIVMADIIGDKIEIHNPNKIGYRNQDRLYTLKEVQSAWKYGVAITKIKEPVKIKNKLKAFKKRIINKVKRYRL